MLIKPRPWYIFILSYVHKEVLYFFETYKASVSVPCVLSEAVINLLHLNMLLHRQ